MASTSSLNPSPSPTPSLRNGRKLRGFLSPSESSLETAKSALKLSLLIVEKALDGLPIPGAKGTIGGLLEVIKGLEVSWSICQRRAILFVIDEESK